LIIDTSHHMAVICISKIERLRRYIV